MVEYRQRPEVKAARRERERRQYQDLREQVVAILGGACAICGTVQRLEVDHVRGGGDVHRRHAGGVTYWRSILNDVHSGEYRLLCGPHNRASRFTIDQIVEIRERYVRGTSSQFRGNAPMLAAEFGTSPAYIKQICRMSADDVGLQFGS